MIENAHFFSQEKMVSQVKRVNDLSQESKIKKNYLYDFNQAFHGPRHVI